MAIERNRVGMLVMLSLIGALIGTVIGRLLEKIIPAFSGILTVGTKLSIDLDVLRFGMDFNIASILGIVITFLIYRKL